MAANEILCFDLLRGSQNFQPSLPGRQKPCCFSELHVIWVSFWLWCCKLRSPACSLEPTLLRGNSLAAEISLQNFSCHPCEPSQPSCAFSTFPTSHIVVKWFLMSIHGYKGSLQLVFSWLFWMTYIQFSCNSRLVLGES